MCLLHCFSTSCASCRNSCNRAALHLCCFPSCPCVTGEMPGRWTDSHCIIHHHILVLHSQSYEFVLYVLSTSLRPCTNLLLWLIRVTWKGQNRFEQVLILAYLCTVYIEQRIPVFFPNPWEQCEYVVTASGRLGGPSTHCTQRDELQLLTFSVMIKHVH